jgi:hypothetical protein
MEVDNDNQVLKWEVVHIVEIKKLVEELAQEGPTIFEE